MYAINEKIENPRAVKKRILVTTVSNKKLVKIFNELDESIFKTIP